MFGNWYVGRTVGIFVGVLPNSPVDLDGCFSLAVNDLPDIATYKISPKRTMILIAAKP